MKNNFKGIFILLVLVQIDLKADLPGFEGICRNESDRFVSEQGAIRPLLAEICDLR